MEGANTVNNYIWLCASNFYLAFLQMSSAKSRTLPNMKYIIYVDKFMDALKSMLFC